MWQVHWSSGLLELQGWSIQDPMQHRTLDMQDARGNFSSTGSVAAAQTSFLAICCPGLALASIPGPHAVVGAATGPTGSLLTQEAGGPSGLTFLCWVHAALSSIVWSALLLLVSWVFGIDSPRSSNQFCRTHLLFKSLV